tara:strand:- start:46 stop:363 length:318 start_codon:yes stop_codon:yes gene_type:complete
MSSAIPTPQVIAPTFLRQGTVVFAGEKPGVTDRALTEVVSITPDDYASGDVLTIGGVDYPITAVTKPTIKTKSGSPLVQKAATIEMPDNTTQPVKRFSFLIVKSF